MSQERILFLTGSLAEYSLREILSNLSQQMEFDFEIEVLGINVAALMHVDWVARKLELEGTYQRIIVPGWCQGDLKKLEELFFVPFERGPKDLYDLPEYFGREKMPIPDLDQYDIEILAEINHAPHFSPAEILKQAKHYRDSGANIIDLGCIPGEIWKDAGDVVRMLRAEDFRISIDSFNQEEVEAAVEAGAELVLSCNQSNIKWAKKLNAELVAIPDFPDQFETLVPICEELSSEGVKYRIDPILEPIGFGFTASLARYYEARKRWPEIPIMMGIGNLTELTEVDSAGVNVILAGVCQELEIHSVLTTEVINWSQSAVREFDLARKLMFHSVKNHVLPKHLESGLVVLRDSRLLKRSEEELEKLASQLKDPNVRIFAECGEIHMMNRNGHWKGTDPYQVFDEFLKQNEKLDAEHAFYLGYEISKARTALQLGKQYTQDAPLDWGFLTEKEISAVHRRKEEKKKQAKKDS